MDNRLKFLYYVYSELWGRRRIVNPGDGIPGQAQSRGGKANPPLKMKCDGE